MNATDNLFVAVEMISLATDVRNAVQYAMDSHLDPTAVDAYAGTGDVRIRNQNYTDYCGYNWHGSSGSTVWGLTTCDTLTGSECNVHTVRFDLSYFSGASVTAERGLAVHELGHTLGLTHRNTESGSMQQNGPYPVGYTSHDIGHINNDLG